MPVTKITQETTVTGASMAFALGISPPAVTKLADKEILTRTEGGKYKLVPSLNKYIANVRAQLRRPAIDEDMEEIKKQKLIEETEKLKRENMFREGQLVDADHALNIQRKIFISVKQQILNIPHKVAPLLVGEDDYSIIHSTLEREIDTVLNELSEKPLEEYINEQRL